MSSSGFFPDLSQIISQIPSWFPDSIDLILVLLLSYALLQVIGEAERRSLWTVRGFIILMLARVVSEKLDLALLAFLLEKLVLGAAVAMAVIFQSQFRRFLEQLGRGEIVKLFKPSGRPSYQSDSEVEKIWLREKKGRRSKQ